MPSTKLFSNKPAGYGITQALRQGNIDIPYEAVQTVVKASFAEAAQLAKPWAMGKSLPTYPVGIVIPIIVIAGPLFEASLDDKSNLIVNQIESGVLVWQSTKNDMCLVHIITAAALETLPAQVKELHTKIATHKEVFSEFLPLREEWEMKRHESRKSINIQQP